MPRFLIIDEGFGCLDTINLGHVAQMLHGIKKYFDFILIISHIGELQNLSDIKLAITQNDNISAIKNCDTSTEYVIKGYSAPDTRLSSRTVSTSMSDVKKTPPKTESSSGKLETITRNGTEYFYCKYCKVELQKRPNAESKHLNSQGHQKRTGKQTKNDQLYVA